MRVLPFLRRSWAPPATCTASRCRPCPAAIARTTRCALSCQLERDEVRCIISQLTHLHSQIRGRGSRCKHILFVLLRVLRLEDVPTKAEPLDQALLAAMLATVRPGYA
jgi:hypothetical protein